MTPDELLIIKVLSKVKMAYASGDKGRRDFFTWVAREDSKRVLNEAQKGLLYQMLHKYRKQIPVTHEKHCIFCNRVKMR